MYSKHIPKILEYLENENNKQNKTITYNQILLYIICFHDEIRLLVNNIEYQKDITSVRIKSFINDNFPSAEASINLANAVVKACPFTPSEKKGGKKKNTKPKKIKSKPKKTSVSS